MDSVIDRAVDRVANNANGEKMNGTQIKQAFNQIRNCDYYTEEQYQKRWLALTEFGDRFQADSRKTVMQLVEAAKAQQWAMEKEKKRIQEMRKYEHKIGSTVFIGGVDEVGRGPLAGPVVAACVILDPHRPIYHIDDSKKLRPQRRQALSSVIIDNCISYGVGVVEPETIDRINILNATYQAMRQAIRQMPIQPTHLLNDAVTIPELAIGQTAIIKGDSLSVSIAAASIVAKVARDNMMIEYDMIYPNYYFSDNKGYGSAQHIEAIRRYGLCPIHRRSFVKNFR